MDDDLIQIYVYTIYYGVRRESSVTTLYYETRAMAISRGYIQLRWADRLRGSSPTKGERDSSRRDWYNNNIHILYLYVYYHRLLPSDESYLGDCNNFCMSNCGDPWSKYLLNNAWYLLLFTKLFLSDDNFFSYTHSKQLKLWSSNFDAYNVKLNTIISIDIIWKLKICMRIIYKKN